LTTYTGEMGMLPTKTSYPLVDLFASGVLTFLGNPSGLLQSRRQGTVNGFLDRIERIEGIQSV
jgi:hypothetical protein